MSIPALEVRGLSKSFGAIEVARQISLTLPRGARYALIGPNGAGKTSFVNLITGVLAPSGGTLLLEGADITWLPQADRARLGIARTFQVNQLFRNLTVLDNLCLVIGERTGTCARQWRPANSRTEIIDEALDHLESLRLVDVALRPVRELPYGRQRLVEIAMALAQKPKVLLLDEPAAGIPSAETHLILDALERLDRDIAILMIEHDMDLVRSMASRVTVLVAGGVLTEGTTDEIMADARVRAVYLGEPATSAAHQPSAGSAHVRTREQSFSPRQAVALELVDVLAGYGTTVVLEGISFGLRQSESLCIIGRNGVGKSTLLATIMGHTTLHGGTVRLHGKDISKIGIPMRADRGLGYVPQEREIFPSLSVRENLELAQRAGRWSLDAVLELFPSLRTRIGNRGNQLSGGEQQMLAIGRALMRNPSVMLMDEPSEGLAPTIVEELGRAIRLLTEMEGLSLVLVEQNTQLALELLPRAIVMDRGRIIYDGPSETLRHDRNKLHQLIGVGSA